MAGSRVALNKAANLWVSRIIPVLLIGIVGYVTWVIVVLICVNYLLDSSLNDYSPRHAAAIAILTLYFTFFLLMAWSYFRLLYVVIFNPGYTPRGPQWHKRQKTRRGGSSGMVEKAEDAYFSSDAQTGPPTTEPAPGLEDFFSRAIFVCKGDGRPRWCSHCLNWKPDRARHCREVDRCVQKMDHFCPWVGGVISETSFKFFLQFTSWAAVFCLYNMVVISIYLAESRRFTGDVDIHWIISVALAGLFFIFSLGMAGSSLQLVLLNVTTIESLSRKSIVWDLAIHMPEPPKQPPTFPTISFRTHTATTPPEIDTDDTSSVAIKTYGILHSKPGENPWDLGPFQNFRAVMGEHWYDCLLPIKYSPCCDHSSEECQYEVGPVVERMRLEAGVFSSKQGEYHDWQEGDGRLSRHTRRQRRRTPRGDTPTGESQRHDRSQLERRDVPDAADIV